MIGTPCFNVFQYEKNADMLVVGSSPYYTLCAENVNEKELWLQQIQNTLSRLKQP
jgi:hypothetical protein